MSEENIYQNQNLENGLMIDLPIINIRKSFN